MGRIQLAGKVAVRCGTVAGALLLGACASLDHQVVPDIVSTSDSSGSIREADADKPAAITVMTLNMAHSRGTGFHQMFQSTDTTMENLRAIQALISQERPHVVALQEADGPSFWSGGFNHVDYLARNEDFSEYVQGNHVSGYNLAYGTALMSRLDLSEPLAVTFDPPFPSVPKGFIISTIRWPSDPSMEIDLVSLHFDALSHGIRQRQARELITTLKERSRPVIIMGDFNSYWQREDSILTQIVGDLDLTVYQPEVEGLETFPFSSKRLDWILISAPLEFRSYGVLQETVSDHRGVVAELVLKKEKDSPGSAEGFARRDPVPGWCTG